MIFYCLSHHKVLDELNDVFENDEVIESMSDEAEEEVEEEEEEEEEATE